MARITGIFQEDVGELYRELFSRLPLGTATLTIRPSNDPAGGEDILLLPVDHRSASISVHVCDRTAYMMLGMNTFSEIFATYRNEKKALERICRISDAVINGRFSEDVWLSKGKIVKAVGTLTIDGKTSKIRFLALFNPFRTKEKKHYDYMPYAVNVDLTASRML